MTVAELKEIINSFPPECDDYIVTDEFDNVVVDFGYEPSEPHEKANGIKGLAWFAI